MRRCYYSSRIPAFVNTPADTILGFLARAHSLDLVPSQRDAWLEQIRILQLALADYPDGHVYFEYSIPRLGRRIDVVLVLGSVIFVLEFKVGASEFSAADIDQVWDYALDLKNFHEGSHDKVVAPILVATEAPEPAWGVATTHHNDGLIAPIRSNTDLLPCVLQRVLTFAEGPVVCAAEWEQARYCPTPTIVEAATALYSGHGVADISRTDASAVNLTQTSGALTGVIANARARREKAICFVTGVPGAGKTLVGLNMATQNMDRANDLYSVFLSGNGPLVAILREALARDTVARGSGTGRRIRKGQALSEVKMFIQNVHHFRDECLTDATRPPIEHVAIFDEAQRAWDQTQTASFMRRKRHITDFACSEPQFLISCLDRHRDWAVIICLVGAGQEINTGEAGISEWIYSLMHHFPQWRAYVSSRLNDSEYSAGGALQHLYTRPHVMIRDELHLGVSMRSFRAENVSLLVKQVLDLEAGPARETLRQVAARYPLVVTRQLSKAKRWLRDKARGTERYGVMVSSQAQRLKPHAIDVRSPLDPVHWFLDGKHDVRSSYYLEDAATEFHVQGLEVDWGCVVWDADLRRSETGWEHWSFCGDRWNRIRKQDRQIYLKNAYRVLLTRARQGMVIVVPEGDAEDPTRRAEYYDSTFHYLRSIGLSVI